MERRLAAILFTDVVDYTVLMGRDEAAARRVRARHEAKPIDLSTDAKSAVICLRPSTVRLGSMVSGSMSYSRAIVRL